MRTYLKINESAYPEALIKEASGLALLSAFCNPELIRIPEVIDVNENQMRLTLVEDKPCCAALAARLGSGLAALHRVEQPRYGLGEDNYIGLNPQRNGWYTDWGRFFIEKRLRCQMSLIKNARLRRAFEKVLDKKETVLLDVLNSGCDFPSLVHGDLWCGNFLSDGQDVWLIDPAVYFADREVDLAMTEMFGGFPEAFYEAYQRDFPSSNSYPLKRDIYNLYHYLNHYNLFGDGYLSSCQRGLVVVEAL